LFYKYRSIQNFKYFVDIILKNRLYGAPYFNMNDPMEGHYIYNLKQTSNQIIRKIKGEKDKLRIISLSRKNDDTLMWAHYANGHRGVVIGVEIDQEKYDVREVEYLNNIFNLKDVIPGRETAKQILTKKHGAWSYEEENRIFIENGQKYAYVTVKEIILGSKMSTQNKGLIKELIKEIKPEIDVYSCNLSNFELQV